MSVVEVAVFALTGFEMSSQTEFNRHFCNLIGQIIFWPALFVFATGTVAIFAFGIRWSVLWKQISN